MHIKFCDIQVHHLKVVVVELKLSNHNLFGYNILVRILNERFKSDE